MLGRVLFALVCLIIATGILLPIYPTEVEAPGVASARDMMAADTAVTGCGDCKPTAASQRVLAVCGHTRPIAAAPERACLHLTVYVLVRPLPLNGRPGFQLVLPKLPTI
jgi:hypothetical protein